MVTKITKLTTPLTGSAKKENILFETRGRRHKKNKR